MRVIQDSYKAVLSELQKECGDKESEIKTMQEKMKAEKMQLSASYKKQEQQIVTLIQTRIELFQQELIARKMKIQELQKQLCRRESDNHEDRNAITQVMSEWSSQIFNVQKKEEILTDELKKLRMAEENLSTEVKYLKEKEEVMRKDFETVSKKYHFVKKMALNYKVR